MMMARPCQVTVLVAAMGIYTVPSFACSIVQPTCVSEINGRESERMDILRESPNVSIFVERSGEDRSLEMIYLVDCRTRQGVQADLPVGTDFRTPILNTTVEYLIEAASSDRKYSLDEIRDYLTAEGLSSHLSRLPEGHCGCTLPPMEVPACPDDNLKLKG